MIDYKKKIADYGKALPTESEKENARYIFAKLFDMGFNLEFIYFAIQHLNGKKLIENNGLLFHKPFQNEVYYLIEKEHKKQQEIEQIKLHNATVKMPEVKIIKVLAPEKPIDKGYINLDEITD